jgi:hypothetical protein
LTLLINTLPESGLKSIARAMKLCHDQKETDFVVNDSRAMVNMAFRG